MNVETVPAATFAALAEAITSSGLVPEEDLQAAVAEAKGDGPHLARILIAKGLLTKFQITALSEGRGASLRVGNYDILDRLGAGGMGTVFKARHRRMKRVVALKVLAAHLSTNPIFVKRFQREVETIACLGHPNVVMAYDADEADVGHFLVMEFVNGLDLAAYVERDGPLPIARAVNCLLQAARGLAYAHAQEIVHRDIKPHNLMMDMNGTVKITDLGLARLHHHGEAPAAVDSSMTVPGGVIGTADYMSPEQAVDSTAIDDRADIYSLGCTLYYLLTGRPPYSGPTIMAILLKHRDAEIPSLLAARPETPPALDDLFRRMMAKRPEDRVQPMSEVVAELEAIARNLPAEDTAVSNTAATMQLATGLPPRPAPAASASTMQVSDRTMVAETSVLPVTVLIVEPSRVQAAIIKSFLQAKSLELVGTVASGGDAIEAIRRLRPRAVISTMQLADVNGLELAQRIRAESQGEAPGFVLITSDAAESDAAELSRVNRVLMLTKPFTAEQLAEALQRVTVASQALSATSLARPPVAGRLDRSQVRVLIVDDSSTARLQVRRVLQGLGFSQFREVADGAYAIAAAAEEICHLIVTDYNMPLMDGRALVSYLKQNPATAAIPILMCTTETEPRVLDPVRKLGVVAVVEKAFPAGVVGPLLDQLF